MPVNPWATSLTESQTAIPDVPVQQSNAYAVPSLSAGDAYQDDFGWAPTLANRPSATETPSAQRLQAIPLYQRDGDPGKPLMHDGLWEKLAADQDERSHLAQERFMSTGWTTPSGLVPGDRRWADNPRRDPPPETRMTSRMSQNTFSFTRLFDQFNRSENHVRQGSARTFNGMHFSMADHRRKYDILGMRPATSRRNTYRIEPTPWDIDIVDMPPTENSNIPEARIADVSLPYPNRSMRLV
jgi:hypothetical protein